MPHVDLLVHANYGGGGAENAELDIALSGSAMSTLAIWCCVVQSCDVSPHNFVDGLAMSSSAFSVAPNYVVYSVSEL